MSGDPLRITHVLRAKPPGELGGADLHVLDLASAQLAQGHDVRVVLLGPAQVSEMVCERGIQLNQSISMRMIDWILTLRSALRSSPPDVLHTHGYRADLIALAMKLMSRRGRRWTSVATAHGFLRTSWGLRILSRLNEFALRRADIVIAVSSTEARRLAQLLRRPVRYVPNGVSHPKLLLRARARVRLGLSHPQRLVAFIGRLSPEKRPDLFVDMAEIVARTHPQVDFVMIGSGPLRSDVERRAGRAAHTKVVVAGMLSDAASLMPAIDVLVCPSDTEGTPRVVIEAMMVGVPVVATRVGGVPDLIANEQTGILVEPDSPVALATAVIRLLDDAAWSGAIVNRAKAHAHASFSVEVMANLVTEVYRAGIPYRVAGPPSRELGQSTPGSSQNSGVTANMDALRRRE